MAATARAFLGMRAWAQARGAYSETFYAGVNNVHLRRYDKPYDTVLSGPSSVSGMSVGQSMYDATTYSRNRLLYKYAVGAHPGYAATTAQFVVQFANYAAAAPYDGYKLYLCADSTPLDATAWDAFSAGSRVASCDAPSAVNGYLTFDIADASVLPATTIFEVLELWDAADNYTTAGWVDTVIDNGLTVNFTPL